MTEKRVPPDWDWVTERHKCSVVKMFESLRLGAKQNVDTMNALATESSAGAWEVFAPLTDSFSVARPGGRSGVRFTRSRDRIDVAGSDEKIKFEVGFTLNNHGECCFVVDGDELDCWQVLRRALEPLFFNTPAQRRSNG